MPISLTRAELYVSVWAEPVQKLSSEFGISGPGLAKLCRRYNIPVPPRGYWAKKAAGKRVRQAALPDQPPGRPDRISFPGPAPERRPDTESPVHPLIAAEADAARAITVSERLQVRHPLLRQMREFWRGSRQPHWVRQDPLPPRLEINVGREQQSRALRLLQALFEALARRGHAVSRAEDGRIAVKVLDETCHLAVRERQRRVKHAEPTRPKSSTPWAPKFEVVGSGELEIRVDRAFNRRTVTDGKRGRLETRLNDVVVVLIESSLAEKADRAAREVAHRAELARQRRVEEARERARQERARVGHLEQLADAADRQQRLRTFAGVLREAVGAVPSDSALGRWLAWIDDHIAAGDVLERFRGHRRTVTLFYCASSYEAAEVLAYGFTDTRSGYGDNQELPAAVVVADVPLERAYGGTVVVTVSLPEGEVLPFEWWGGDRGYRTFRVPAAILNRYPRVAG